MAKKTILIIDDEADFIDVVKVRLEALGYKVIGAYNGEEGVDVARKERPDLIFLDLVMPKSNGFTALSKLRLDPHTALTPVIILSAKSESEFMLDAEKLGAVDYVIKPATLKAMVDMINKHIK